MRHGLLDERVEVGEGDGDARRRPRPWRPRGPERRDRQRHRDPVVAVGAQLAPTSGRPPSITSPSGSSRTSRPERREPLAQRGDPVALLDPQLPGAGDCEAALGEGRGRGERRHLVDQRRHERGVDRSCRAGARRTRRSSRPARARSPRDEPRPRRPSPAARRRRRCGWARAARRRARAPSRAARARPRPGTPRSRRRPGRDVRAPSRAPPRTRGPQPLAPDGDAEGRQHALGVVAAGARLADRRLALGLQPREQHGRLHLRAGDGQLVARSRAAGRPRSSSAAARRS